VGFPIFAITDGTDRIDLLTFLSLKEFKSSIIEPEGGGIWGSSPFSDGRIPIAMQFGNLMIESIFSAHGCDQDDLAYKAQLVRRLLENARQYWLSPSWKTPVWVEMRGSNETNIRYAYIFDYRAPGTGNPFAAPTFDNGNSMMIFPLILETTPWQSNPLGSSNCIEISSLQRAIISGSTITAHFHVISSDDDAEVAYPSYDVVMGDVTAKMGTDINLMYKYFTIFRNITIPVGSIITSAFIRYTAASNQASTPVTLRIYGERDIDPPAYCDDYFICFAPTTSGSTPRIYTYSYVDWDPGIWTQNTQYDTPDISNIVQEIINLEGWESGCDIAINTGDKMAKTAGPYYYRDAYTFDNGSKDPELHIIYSPPADVGVNATCSKEVIISNKHNKAQINQILLYDKNVGYIDLIAAGYPYALFPAVPVAGDDYLLIGIDTAYMDSGPFRSLVFNLSIACSGITFTVKYSQTAAFAAVIGATDNTNALSVLGVSSYHFKPPLDFDHQVISGKDCWWIKLDITGVAGTYVVPVQQDRNIYTIVTPYFDINEDQVRGDLPVLARTLLFNRGYSTNNPMWNNPSAAAPYAKKIFLATRKLSRGEDFTPYLNASDWQLPPGITYTVAGAGDHVTMEEDTAVDVLMHTAEDIDGSPTGKMTLFDYPHTVIDPLTIRGTWTFAYNIARQYAGRYAAYLRCTTEGPGAINFQIGLQLCYGLSPNYTTYPTKTIFLNSNPMFTYVDSFSIMEDLMEDEYLANFHINLMIGIPEDIAYSNLYIYDLIVVPVDEFLYTAETESTILAVDAPPNGNGVYIDADSIGNPKIMRSVARVEINDDKLANLIRMSRNPWMLNPRTSQRIWFFSPASMNISYIPKQYGIFRYFDLRGKD